MSSMLPNFFESWNSSRPSYILDQRFGCSLSPVDLSTPLIYPISALTIGTGRTVIPNYNRPWRPITAIEDHGSALTFDINKFQAILDVQQFAPHEITVKVVGQNNIIVEAKHDERQDQHGYVARQFIRRYVLPEDYDIDKIFSSLSSDGVLTIVVPRLSDAEEQRSVPVMQTGVPIVHLQSPTSAKSVTKSIIATTAKTVGAASAPEPALEKEKEKQGEAKNEKQGDEKKE